MRMARLKIMTIISLRAIKPKISEFRERNGALKSEFQEDTEDTERHLGNKVQQKQQRKINTTEHLAKNLVTWILKSNHQNGMGADKVKNKREK